MIIAFSPHPKNDIIHHRSIYNSYLSCIKITICQSRYTNHVWLAYNFRGYTLGDLKRKGGGKFILIFLILQSTVLQLCYFLSRKKPFRTITNCSRLHQIKLEDGNIAKRRLLSVYYLGRNHKLKLLSKTWSRNIVLQLLAIQVSFLSVQCTESSNYVSQKKHIRQILLQLRYPRHWYKKKWPDTL